jgi:dipeptidyl-peptidase-4
LYPETYTYKYPKAGENNSIVSVWVYDLKSGKNTRMDVGPVTDQYIPRVYWTKTPGQLAILRMNRLQNKVEMLLADASNGKSKVAWMDSNAYYVDITNDYHFLENKNQFITFSERTGYNHVWLFPLDPAMANAVTEITRGIFDVGAISAIDEENKWLYYTAAAVNPMERELYVCNFDGSHVRMIDGKPGQTEAEFSGDARYYVSSWSDVNTPPVVTVRDNNGAVLRTLADNKAINERLSGANCPKKEFLTIDNGVGYMMNAWMVKPTDFDPAKKYPVLIYTYGGPGSQTVENSWGYYYHLFDLYMAQKGYIVVSVDGRGSGGRGEAYKKCTYKQLGLYEAEDQISAAYELAKLPYVDAKRIGIWGWSYGGFLTALCLEKGDGIFKTGVAVAPVTSWRYYDNIYTERFMQKPQDNPSGYDDNSPLNFADLLKGDILIMHGTSDNNVHMQNTLELTKALVNAGKQFEMQLYTDKEHSIRGGKTRVHLFNRIEEFLKRKL